MVRPCAKCGENITVTEQMLKCSKYTCGPCLSAASVARAKRNPEQKRAANNAWHSRNSDKRAARTRLYRARHPERRLAHQAVQTALRNGSLTREACSVCGGSKAHAHHDDYSKPLVVIWLCHTHHMERHAMLFERKRGQ
jgi:hypothetical protein